MNRGRFPRSVFGSGTEPDARFSLANERTFLAWTRTSLALMAGGVALETLGLDLEPTLRLIASSLLLAGGILTPVQAWLGWARTERALRSRAALPPATLALPLVVLLVTVGLIILAAVVIGPTG